MEFTDAISTLSGIGEKTALLFSKQGVNTLRELLYFFPRNYREIPMRRLIRDLEDKKQQIVYGKIVTSPKTFVRGRKKILSFEIEDETGRVGVTFFGMPYLKKTMIPGKELWCFGSCRKSGGHFVFEHPKCLKEEEYHAIKGTLMPIYSLTEGLSNEKVRKAVHSAFPLAYEIKEYLSVEKQKEYGLLGIQDALHKIHMPKTMEDVYKARNRLAFDEFLAFLWNLEKLKKGNQKVKTEYLLKPFDMEENLIRKLPYDLTNAQRRVYEEIVSDYNSGYQMNRLVQGDVGSGKTILAIMAALHMIHSGYQVALMAPTEVLAKQHFQDICQMEDKLSLGMKLGLLTGTMKAKEKKEAYAAIESGEVNFIIGTHALIQEKVEYHNLALVITDEQHRFGVKQRSALMNKGNMVHVLVMSATPIPRTLGLILYGDLDVSLVDELPASRLPIKNTVVGPEYREKLYQFMLKRILEGRQVYIICPMVEEGEGLDVENVLDYTEMLKEKMPPFLRIGYLHGKMKSVEKEGVMQEFKEHRLDILVSTTVIEVGVNVPNATVMMIENAERFGLAQLHQLRGRVGRGVHQSYAVFVVGSDSKKAKERLEILNHTNDGFKIAEEDLKQRGPGDFFGYRQSGLPGFKVADIYSDAEILMKAKNYLSKEKISDIDFRAICL